MLYILDPVSLHLQVEPGVESVQQGCGLVLHDPPSPSDTGFMKGGARGGVRGGVREV